MNDKDSQEKLAIFNVGHSTHSLETFLDLLQSHKIDVLLDVRSKPFSRFSPQFNKEELEKAVRARGIKYLFLGKELGGRPQDSEFYDAKDLFCIRGLRSPRCFLTALIA